MKKNIFKSAVAVLAGLITVIILSNGTDMLLEASGIFPSAKEQLKNGFTTLWMLLLALLYRTAFMVIGGYVTARLAPAKPMQHIMALGIIGTVFGILGAIAAWGIAPAWFLILITLLGFPAVWSGGKLNSRKKWRNNYAR